MLELFTLGADRGYDQDDVHQNSRALTGWTNDWSEAARPDQLPVRAQPPRLRDKADLRSSRTVRLARQLPTGGQPTPSIRRSWSASCGTTSSVRRSSARHGARARAGVRPQRLRDPAAHRGDPPSPAVLRRAATRHAASGVDGRVAAGQPPDDHDHELGLGRGPHWAGAVPAPERVGLELRPMA